MDMKNSICLPQHQSTTNNRPAQPQPHQLSRLLRLPEVKARVGLSRSSIYAGIDYGTFPPPIHIGQKAVAWVESDITDWINEKIADSIKEVDA